MAIAVSILLLMSDMCCAIRLWAYLVIVLNVKIDNQTEKKVSINTSLLDRVNDILPREEGRGIKWPVSVPNEYYSTWWVQSKLGVFEMKYVLQWNKQFSTHRMGIENRNAGIYKELTQAVLVLSGWLFVHLRKRRVRSIYPEPGPILRDKKHWDDKCLPLYWCVTYP